MIRGWQGWKDDWMVRTRGFRGECYGCRAYRAEMIRKLFHGGGFRVRGCVVDKFHRAWG